MLAGMENTARLFVLSVIPACGVVHMPDGTPDAGTPPDALTLTDAFPGDFDAAPFPDAGACAAEPFYFADLPAGFVGEMAVLDTLGTLTGESCQGETCKPARLYASDFGLGVEGSRIGGDGVSGLDRVALRLDAPAAVGYRMYAGLNSNSDLRVHHRVTAYLDEALVLDDIISGPEYELGATPLANLVLWSAVVVGPNENAFADDFAIAHASVCRPEPRAPARRSNDL